MIGALSFPAVLAALFWSRIKAHHGQQWRRSLLEAVTLFACGTIAVTESLGVLHAFRPSWISLVWALAGIASVGFLWRELKRPDALRAEVFARLRQFSIKRPGDSWTTFEWAALLFIAGSTCLIAWLSPPTNYDSMSYQMSRVMHWFQQGSLEHYRTSNVRQLAYGPGAAYWQANLWAVFDGDLAANLPQWAALIGSAVALTLWVQRFFDLRATGLAVLAGITLPMALLQSCSSQSDLQVGCWMLFAAVFLSEPATPPLTRALFSGGALGLAILTKPSAALLVVPLATIAWWRMGRRSGFRNAFSHGVWWVVIALVVNLPHFSRNIRWFGSPLGTDLGTVVESLSPKLMASNAARWTTLNIPSLSVWRITGETVQRLGIDPNDPANTFSDAIYAPPSSAVVYRLLLPDEDFVSYTGTLLALVVLALVARRLNRRNTTTSAVGAEPLAPWLTALLVALGFHFLLLKWQWWGNRLLLPWMLLAVPLLIAATGTWKHRRLRTGAAVVLMLQSVFVLTFSINRPLVPLPTWWNFIGAKTLFSASRTDRFYSGYNAGVAPVGQQLVATVRQMHAHRVGLIVDEDYPEYVLWRSLHDAKLDDVEIYHLNAPPPPRGAPGRWPPAVDLSIAVEAPHAEQDWAKAVRSKR